MNANFLPSIETKYNFEKQMPNRIQLQRDCNNWKSMQIKIPYANSIKLLINLNGTTRLAIFEFRHSGRVVVIAHSVVWPLHRLLTLRALY